MPGTGPYTVTATNGATFGLNLGVVYAASGAPFGGREQFPGHRPVFV